MNRQLKDYFMLNRTERNGAMILVILIFIFFAAAQVVQYIPQYSQTDYSEFEKEVDAFLAAELADSIADAQSKKPAPIDTATATEGKYFKFNPNHLPEEKWISLGFTPKQAEAIKRIEAKGFRFNKKEDMLKVYFINLEKYMELEPYIDIPIASGRENSRFEAVRDSQWRKNTYTPKPKEVIMVELNAADTLELMRIRGVGAAFARRIFNYKNRLGGFHSKEQLLEVWGLDSLKYSEISDQVKVDKSQISKININTAPIDTLKLHPYITYTVARFIVNYRLQHGRYKNTESIRDPDLVNEELWRKLAPYLTTE